jgi:hypothetical protein
MLATLAPVLSGVGVAPVTSSYFSIATQTVGSGGASSITFSSIPSTFTHLQLRVFAQTNRGTYGRDEVSMQLGNGSIDTGNNYSWHNVSGDGGSPTGVYANSGTTQNYMKQGEIGTGVGSNFGALICDILDYANTSKYKTLRTLSGGDINGTIAGYGGTVNLYSGLWQSSSLINTLFIAPVNGTQFNQYSSFALYGVN